MLCAWVIAMKHSLAFAAALLACAHAALAAGVDTALIATDITSVDFLVAKAAAEKAGAPVFAAEGGAVSEDVRNELASLNVKTVVLVGGPAVITADAEAGLKSLGYNVVRLWGLERTATAAEVARHFWPDGAGCAVLVDDTKDSDADTVQQSDAADLAASGQCPLVPVPKGKVPADVLKLLDELGTRVARHVGASSSEIREKLAGLTLEEYAGSRDEARKKIDDAVDAQAKKSGKKLKMVIVAAPHFKHVHSTGAEPSENGVSRIVTSAAEATALAGYIKEKGITDVKVVGSPALAQDVAAELEKQGITVKRVSGEKSGAVAREVLLDTRKRWEEKRSERAAAKTEMREKIKKRLVERLNETNATLREDETEAEDLRLEGAATDKLAMLKARIDEAKAKLAEIRALLDEGKTDEAADLMATVKDLVSSEKFRHRSELKRNTAEEIEDEEESDSEAGEEADEQLKGIEQRFSQLREKCGNITEIEAIVAKAKELREKARTAVANKEYRAAGKILVEVRTLTTEAHTLRKSCEKEKKISKELKRNARATTELPSVAIAKPDSGETITGSIVRVKVDVDNFRVVPLRDVARGEGHVHVWLDDTELKGPKREFVFENVTSGAHKLKAELRRSDHTALEPVVASEEIEITVTGGIEPAVNGTPSESMRGKTGKNKFSVEGDDSGLYPSSLDVEKGEVEITFTALSKNVYYGGLDFKSDYFDTGKVAPGESKTVSFTATKSFSYKSYWPASGVVKANGTITVK